MDNPGYKPVIKKDNEQAEAEFVFDFAEEAVFHNKEWKGMPEFKCDDLQPWKQIIVSFKNIEALKEFAKLINQKITCNTPSIWFPEVKLEEVINKRYVDEYQVEEEKW